MNNNDCYHKQKKSVAIFKSNYIDQSIESFVESYIIENEYSVSKMFGYERESVNNTIIDNYDDFSCDISLPSDVTLDSGSDNDYDNEMILLRHKHIKIML